MEESGRKLWNEELFAWYCYSDRIKEDEMGGQCSMYGEVEKYDVFKGYSWTYLEITWKTIMDVTETESGSGKVKKKMCPYACHEGIWASGGISFNHS
jgi:hypothetical protein